MNSSANLPEGWGTGQPAQRIIRRTITPPCCGRSFAWIDLLLPSHCPRCGHPCLDAAYDAPAHEAFLILNLSANPVPQGG